MANPFLGQVISVGFPWAPINWYPCDGRPLSIPEHTALFQLLGTTYGGDGVNTFNLPNLNGRLPLGQGQGQGLSNYVPGQTVGTESVALTIANGPQHTHTISFSQIGATTQSPKPISSKNVAMGTNVNTAIPGFYVAAKDGTVALKGDTIAPVGSGIPHENRQPFVALNYIICYAGIYPTQN
jgi:microcystin-dependent protein